jgi:hypothetical protein
VKSANFSEASAGATHSPCGARTNQARPSDWQLHRSSNMAISPEIAAFAEGDLLRASAAEATTLGIFVQKRVVSGIIPGSYPSLALSKTLAVGDVIEVRASLARWCACASACRVVYTCVCARAWLQVDSLVSNHDHSSSPQRKARC